MHKSQPTRHTNLSHAVDQQYVVETIISNNKPTNMNECMINAAVKCSLSVSSLTTMNDFSPILKIKQNKKIHKSNSDQNSQSSRDEESEPARRSIKEIFKFVFKMLQISTNIPSIRYRLTLALFKHML